MMGNDKENETRSNKGTGKPNSNLKKILFAALGVIVVIGIISGFALQHGKEGQQEAQKTSQKKSSTASIKKSSVSKKSSSKNVSSATVASETKSVTAESQESSTQVNQGSPVTAQEKSMIEARRMLVYGIEKTIYYNSGTTTPNFDHMEEIAGGFRVYFADGSIYNVRDRGVVNNLAPEYNFGGNQSWELYFDHKPAVVLDAPSQIGAGWVGIDPTSTELQQYGVR
ncbi:hypothetical protein ESZ50_07525 [Weissella muntiaci]|uniref:Uncharacterized protein n=1 Tax=Weissella muntiaci TaxID=2508881 RepID=A0A6C2C5F5_9LACO|nr:hypothetical protein [Weissella muntiaci]TYC49087.1 hypothetical protein ESZ50_07525 [Weissella muntiaci]